jgi:hypothetical protein
MPSSPPAGHLHVWKPYPRCSQSAQGLGPGPAQSHPVCCYLGQLCCMDRIRLCIKRCVYVPRKRLREYLQRSQRLMAAHHAWIHHTLTRGRASQHPLQIEGDRACLLLWLSHLMLTCCLHWSKPHPRPLSCNCNAGFRCVYVHLYGLPGPSNPEGEVLLQKAALAALTLVVLQTTAARLAQGAWVCASTRWHTC